MIGQSANDARTSWAERGFFLALLVICLLPLSKNQPGPDFWGHVQYGSDLLREGLPTSTPYTYNAVGNNWGNHETLSELAMAVGIQSLGGVGLLCIKCLLGAVLMAVIIHRSRRAGVSQMTIVVMALFTSINLMHFWLLRPQLASYMFFASLVLILDWAVPRDELTQLFGRRSKYDAPASPEYLSPSRRSITETKQTGYVQWPALPIRQTPQKLAVR